MKKETEVMKMNMSLSKLKYLITECLELHPFMPIIEYMVVNELNKYTIR